MEIIKSSNDFYTSVEKALDEIDLKWRDYKGLLVLGTHSPDDIEKKLHAIENARIDRRPALGICFGMQLMAVEYAKNQCGIEDACSEEYSASGSHIITKLPRIRVGLQKVAGWWGTTDESHWHNYSFNSSFKDHFKDSWEMSENDGVVEIIRYKNYPFFVGVQFHPEYQSTKERPHPVLKDFIDVCSRIK